MGPRIHTQGEDDTDWAHPSGMSRLSLCLGQCTLLTGTCLLLTLVRVLQTDGKFWLAAYGTAGRKHFSPLNGDIKPDTSRMRELLIEDGWL
jgi:hypothetical protein